MKDLLHQDLQRVYNYPARCSCVTEFPAAAKLRVPSSCVSETLQDDWTTALAALGVV